MSRKVRVHEDYGVEAVEIKFAGKPSGDVREKLRNNKFRWSGANKVWYKTKPKQKDIDFAKSL